MLACAMQKHFRSVTWLGSWYHIIKLPPPIARVVDLAVSNVSFDTIDQIILVPEQ